MSLKMFDDLSESEAKDLLRHIAKSPDHYRDIFTSIFHTCTANAGDLTDEFVLALLDLGADVWNGSGISQLLLSGREDLLRRIIEKNIITAYFIDPVSERSLLELATIHNRDDFTCYLLSRRDDKDSPTDTVDACEISGFADELNDCEDCCMLVRPPIKPLEM